MRNIILLYLLFVFTVNAYSQTRNADPLRRIKVPEHLALVLDSAYKEITGWDNVNAGRNVWSLSKSGETILKNGIFTFKGQGPDFQYCIFIFYNNDIYVFRSKKSKNYFEDILQEYINAIKVLRIEQSDKAKFLSSIADYLKSQNIEIQSISPSRP